MKPIIIKEKNAARQPTKVPRQNEETRQNLSQYHSSDP